MYGKDYAYAQTRIQNTIVRLLKDGEPVYIHRVDAFGVCVCSYLNHDWDNMSQTFVVGLDDLDLHPVPLGYVNCAGEATYLMRIPMRRDWKQGLRQENCYSSGRRLYEIPMKDVRNCIMGKYPTFKKAASDVKIGVSKGRNKTIAWNRHWAISTNGVVYYKNHEPVGQYDNHDVVLSKQYEYLKECLFDSQYKYLEEAYRTTKK